MKTIKIIDNPKIKTSTLIRDLKAYSHWNDEELDKLFPPPKETTTRYFELSQDPDPETMNKSYNDLEREGHTKDMMTLREYAIFQKEYFEKTGKHPDEIGWTLLEALPGDGRVALGGWDARHARARFIWFCGGYCLPNIGARLAVTLNPSSLISSETKIEPQLLGIIADIANEVDKLKSKHPSAIGGVSDTWFYSIMTRLNELKK